MRERANQEQGKTQKAALLEQAEEAAAKLKELRAKLAGTWVLSLADTEPQVVALATRLVPAAECLGTVRESLVSPMPSAVCLALGRRIEGPKVTQQVHVSPTLFLGRAGDKAGWAETPYPDLLILPVQ